jgi:hypothetical protein
VSGSAALLLRAAWADSVTNDEGIYIHSGVCALDAGVIDLEPTNPAGFKLMAGLGAKLSGVKTDTRCESFAYWSLLERFDLDALRTLVFFARVPTILVTLALILGATLWAHRMAGWPGALLTAALVGFDPTVLAHGHIATGDIPLTAGIAGTLACLWTWRRTGLWRWPLLAGVAFAFALLNKVSALALLPVLVVLVVATARGGLASRLRDLKVAVPFSAASFVVVTAVYAPFRFSQPSPPLLPEGLGWLLPQSWLWGVKWQLARVRGSGNAMTYLNGEIVPSGSFLYFPEAFLLKSTLGTLAAIAIGGLLLLLRRRVLALWTLLPALVLFASAVQGGVNLGVRYIAPAIVLLEIGAAVGLAMVANRWRRTLSASLAGAGVIAVALGPVGSMGYFNALATKPHSYYLGDSNVDFGQDGWRLRDWWVRAGRPPIQADFFGYLPASYYIPTARDVGAHGERLTPDPVSRVDDRILIVSLTTGTVNPDLVDEVKDARCFIGTGLVILNARDCATGRL